MIRSSIGWKGICFSIGAMLLFSTICMQAQTPESPRWPNFRREIGVDFSNFLDGKKGMGVVIKHQVGVIKQGTEWQKTWALRLSGVVYTKNFDKNDDFMALDTMVTYAWVFNNKITSFQVGGEHQFTKRKSRIAVGGSLGFSHKASKANALITRLFNSTIIRTEKFKSNTITNTTFLAVSLGYQYFIVPRLSVGLEININFGFEYVEDVYMIEGGKINMDTSSNGITGGSFPSLLYLSFHF